MRTCEMVFGFMNANTHETPIQSRDRKGAGPPPGVTVRWRRREMGPWDGDRL